MFRGDLLIDGYNVLHAAGLARRSYGPGEFEKTRRRLLKLLAGQLVDRERQRTTVVFDAPEHTLGPSPPTTIHGIRVIFADRDGDADAAIERLIQQNSAPRRLHVISSDHRLQKAARRRRSRFLDSEAFLARIARRPTPGELSQTAEPAEKREGLTSPGEIDVWLQTFAGIDGVQALEESVDKPAGSSVADAGAASHEVSKPVEERADDSVPVVADEVSFWERRIAELWAQTGDG